MTAFVEFQRSGVRFGTPDPQADCQVQYLPSVCVKVRGIWRNFESIGSFCVKGVFGGLLILIQSYIYMFPCLSPRITSHTESLCKLVGHKIVVDFLGFS